MMMGQVNVVKPGNMRQNGKLVNCLEREDKIARRLSIVGDRNKSEHKLTDLSIVDRCVWGAMFICTVKLVFQALNFCLEEDIFTITHFTVVCWVTWPLSRSEAGGDLVLIQSSLSFSCKFGLISVTTTWFTREKQWGLYSNKVTPSLAFTQKPGHSTHNCKMGYSNSFSLRAFTVRSFRIFSSESENVL